MPNNLLHTTPQIDSTSFVYTSYLDVSAATHKAFMQGIADETATETLLVERRTVLTAKYAGQSRTIVSYENKRVADGVGDWVFVLLIFSFFLFAWLKLFFTKTLASFLKSPIRYKTSFRLFRENNMFTARVSAGLQFIFLLNSSLFILLIAKFYNFYFFGYSDFFVFLAIFAGIFFFYSFRFSKLRLLAYVFKVQAVTKEYLYNVSLYNKFYGLLLFPIIIAFSYMLQVPREYIIYLAAVLFLLIYILQVIRIFFIILRKRLSLSYMILYLCTLEILPTLLLIKYVNMNL